MQLFAIRDNKVEAYNSPFTAANYQVAIRMVTDTASDTNTMFNRHPEDFEIYHIGEFDEKTGIVESCPHVQIGKIIDFIWEEK